MHSGKWIRELREERSIKSGDIERFSRAIAEAKGSPDFYISRSTLCEIETGSVPSVHKLFSLAGCLKVSLEELLLAFGVDIDELRLSASEGESSLARGSQLEVREPDFRFQLNFETGFESPETSSAAVETERPAGAFSTTSAQISRSQTLSLRSDRHQG